MKKKQVFISKCCLNQGKLILFIIYVYGTSRILNEQSHKVWVEILHVYNTISFWTSHIFLTLRIILFILPILSEVVHLLECFEACCEISYGFPFNFQSSPTSVCWFLMRFSYLCCCWDVFGIPLNHNIFSFLSLLLGCIWYTLESQYLFILIFVVGIYLEYPWITISFPSYLCCCWDIFGIPLNHNIFSFLSLLLGYIWNTLESQYLFLLIFVVVGIYLEYPWITISFPSYLCCWDVFGIPVNHISFPSYLCCCWDVFGLFSWIIISFPSYLCCCWDVFGIPLNHNIFSFLSLLLLGYIWNTLESQYLFLLIFVVVGIYLVYPWITISFPSYLCCWDVFGIPLNHNIFSFLSLLLLGYIWYTLESQYLFILIFVVGIYLEYPWITISFPTYLCCCWDIFGIPLNHNIFSFLSLLLLGYIWNTLESQYLFLLIFVVGMYLVYPWITISFPSYLCCCWDVFGLFSWIIISFPSYLCCWDVFGIPLNHNIFSFLSLLLLGYIWNTLESQYLFLLIFVVVGMYLEYPWITISFPSYLCCWDVFGIPLNHNIFSFLSLLLGCIWNTLESQYLFLLIFVVVGMYLEYLWITISFPSYLCCWDVFGIPLNHNIFSFLSLLLGCIWNTLESQYLFLLIFVVVGIYLEYPWITISFPSYLCCCWDIFGIPLNHNIFSFLSLLLGCIWYTLESQYIFLLIFVVVGMYLVYSLES